MKTPLIYFIPLMLFNSCVANDDFDIPEIPESDAVHVDANTDLNAVLGAYYQDPEKIITFNKDIIFEAYVISSDEAGNFYKELIVQDKPEHPLAGLNIKINLTSYSQYFNFGRKLLINARGLSIGKMNGVPTLGVVDGKQIVNIPQKMISDHIFRTGTVSSIVPLKIEALEFQDRYKNIFVQLDQMQFSAFLIGPENSFTFSSEEVDEFDGERAIESCTGDFPFILSTSTYADFSAIKLPAGSGSIQGVLTRDYYDKFYTVFINSPSDIQFTENRCEEVSINCGVAATAGSKILFSEDFSEQTNNKPVKGKGWKLVVQEGSKQWEVYTATGTNASLGKSVRVKPSGSGDRKTVSWLITPVINFDTNFGEVLSFKTSTSFSNGSMLDVLISTDWDGTDENFHASEWKLLSAAYIAQNNDFFGDWISSGNIDLSCVEGKGHIGFRYTGSDSPYYNGIYELDEIVVTAN